MIDPSHPSDRDETHHDTDAGTTAGAAPWTPALPAQPAEPAEVDEPVAVAESVEVDDAALLDSLEADLAAVESAIAAIDRIATEAGGGEQAAAEIRAAGAIRPATPLR